MRKQKHKADGTFQPLPEAAKQRGRCVNIDDTLWEKVETMAQQMNTTLSGAVRECIQQATK